MLVGCSGVRWFVWDGSGAGRPGGVGCTVAELVAQLPSHAPTNSPTDPSHHPTHTPLHTQPPNHTPYRHKVLGFHARLTMLHLSWRSGKSQLAMISWDMSRLVDHAWSLSNFVDLERHEVSRKVRKFTFRQGQHDSGTTLHDLESVYFYTQVASGTTLH